ncbi:MAG: O-acetylhomoserine aminocarboxypropyltransferase/cysteine synthase family protein [Planctomycetota bacterium]|jgi:O-acetylhomoserine (thiol)-lyase
MRADTVAIHGGFEGDLNTGTSTPPIYQTVSYKYRTAKELADVYAGRGPGYIYTRIANPTTYALERRLGQLEGGLGCIATASGMAAITTVVTGLLRTGDELVASSGIFGGTLSLFLNTLGRFGIKTTLVDAAQSSQFARAINNNTKLIFIETIGNPRMDVADIPTVAQIARNANIPLIVDNTTTTPFLIKPKEFGADIVVHSTSKFINGHGTAIGGAIIDTGNYDWSGGVFEDIKRLSQKAGDLAFLAHLRNLIYRDLGGCAAPVNSFLMMQGLETLSARMQIHCANALCLADYLNGHDNVRWVNYPGLADSKFYDRTKKLFGGCGGGVLTFGLGDRKKAFKFIDSLNLAKNMANLGDAKTMVLHPASTIFHEFSDEAKKQMDVTGDMVRVSVGIEDFEDIKNDFEQAIEKAFEVQE